MKRLTLLLAILSATALALPNGLSLSNTAHLAVATPASGGGGGNPYRTGLVLELIADNLTGADGSAVASWTDTSPSGTPMVQSTSGQQPLLKLGILNGHKIVRSDGVDDVLTVSLSVTSATVFLVAKSVAGTSNPRLGGWTSTASFYTPGVWAYYASSGNTHGNIFNVGSSSVSSVVSYTRDNGGSPMLMLRVNGDNNYADGTSLFYPWTGTFYLFSDDSAEYAACDVAEVLIYSSVLTTTQRQSVAGYLGTKYGITITN